MKNLEYYIAEVKRQNPGISDKDATVFANKIYKMDPASDFTGKRPKLDATFKLFKANEKAKTVTTPAVTPTPSPAPSTSTTKSPSDVNPNKTKFSPIATGIQTNFLDFVDGTLVYNAGGTGQAALEPYISGRSTPEQPNPKPIVILPTADGRYYIVGDLDNYVTESIRSIPRGDIAKYKIKLKDYYPSKSAFNRSYKSGPVTDQDLDFANAVKKALQQITVNNFNTGVLIGNKLQEDKNFVPNSVGFYSFDSWIDSRQLAPEPSSASESTSGITSEVDALAEFRRTVQQYVGDFDLVNEYDALAQVYVEMLNAEELKRKSTRISSTNPLGQNTFSESYAITQLSELDRLEMRLKLITQGAKGTKGKQKGKIISTGIRDANPIDLQDAGGSIGDNYTKLKSYAFDYGVRLDDSQLKLKAAESLLPGGSIEEQRRTIQLASRAFYKPLAPYIEAGLKVSDIADQFKKIKINELELADGSVDIFDKDVQAAISGDKLWRPDEMIMSARLDPRWRQTKKANESAAGLVDTILKLWGQVG